MDERAVALALKREVETISPRLWENIELRVKQQVRYELFQKLERVPSPKGTFIRDRKAHLLKNISKIGA